MKSNSFRLVVLASCCLVACALLVPAVAGDMAFASTNGADSDTAASGSAPDSSVEESDNPIEKLFGFLFGKSSGKESDPSSSADASSSAAQASPTSEDDPFSKPVESEADAVNRVHDCLMRAGKEVPPKIEFSTMVDGGRYLIHGYEVVNDGGGSSHQATWFFYSVGRDGSIFDETAMCFIDPLTMEKVDRLEVHKNDYYVLSLPPDLANADIKYEQGKFGGPTTVGAITTVIKDGKKQFDVACFSDDWGPQGTMVSVKIGTPSADPSCVVYLLVPAWPLDGGGYDYDTANAKAREYALYVAPL